MVSPNIELKRRDTVGFNINTTDSNGHEITIQIYPENPKGFSSIYPVF